MSEKIKEYPGERIKTADLRAGLVPLIKYKPEAKYAWSAGIAMSRFLNELKNGRILASVCKKCNRIVVPPRVFCEMCFKPVDGYTYVKDTGKVNTYSISYIAADASRVKEPTIVAVIELDGASPGIGILHVLGEVKPEEVKSGMRVKAVWKPPEQREGAITDIKYFKPIGEGEM